MAVEKEVYVAHECRVCESVFMDVDEINSQDYAPTYKCCKDCLSKGYKNSSKHKARYVKWLAFNKCMESVLDEKQIKDQFEVEFITRKCRELISAKEEFNQVFQNKPMVNQAIEILNYMNEDELAKYLRSKKGREVKDV